MLAPRSRAGPIGSTLGCWAAAMRVHPAIRVVASVTVRRMVERLLWLRAGCFAMANYSAQQIVRLPTAGSQVGRPSGDGSVRPANR